MRTILLLLLLLLPANAAAEWRPAQTVHSAEYPVFLNEVDTAIAADGSGVVVLSETGSEPAVFVAEVDADGTVAPARRLSPEGVPVRRPRLAMAPGGRVALIWTIARERYGQRGFPRPTQLLQRTAAGNWSAPKTISKGRFTTGSDVAFEPDGTIAVAWTRGHVGGARVNVTRVSPSGAVVSHKQLQRRGAYRPQLATSPAFPRAAVAYRVIKRGYGPTEARLWLGGRDLLLNDGPDAEVAIAASDRLFVAHTSRDQPATLTLSTFKPDGSRSDRQVGTDAEYFGEPSLSATGDDYLLAYIRAAGQQGDFRVVQAGQDPFDLDPGHYARTIVGGLSPVRSVAVVNRMPGVDGPANGLDGHLFATTGTPRGGFGPLTEISRADEFLSYARPISLAVAPSGATLVAYEALDAARPDGSGPKHISVTTLPPRAASNDRKGQRPGRNGTGRRGGAGL